MKKKKQTVTVSFPVEIEYSTQTGKEAAIRSLILDEGWVDFYISEGGGACGKAKGGKTKVTE